MHQSFTRLNRFAERRMQAPDIKDQYHNIVLGMMATNFTNAACFPPIHAMARVIRSSLSEDPMLSMPQFNAALAEANQPLLATDADRERNGYAGRARSGAAWANPELR